MISNEGAGPTSRSTSASWDSGTPVIRMIRCSNVPARASTSRTTGTVTASSHIGCSSPGGPGSTRTTGPPVHLHDEARGRPDRLQHRRTPRHERLLAVPGPQRVVAHVAPASAQRADPSPDPLLQRIVEVHGNAGEGGHDVGGQVVGRRAEPAGRDHQVQVAEELEAGAEIVGAVGHDVHGDQLDAAIAQPLRQPRAVLVADDPRQDLGPGDDDAGADDAHDEQSGRCASDSRRGRRPGRSS